MACHRVPFIFALQKLCRKLKPPREWWRGRSQPGGCGGKNGCILKARLVVWAAWFKPTKFMNDAPFFFDLRPLQDGNYKYRGVGYYIASLLRGRAGTEAAAHELIGLIDPDSEEVPAEYSALVDSLSGCWNR